MKSTKEIWDSLEEKYDSEVLPTKKYAVSRRIKFQMEDGKSIMAQIHEYETLRYWLKARKCVNTYKLVFYLRNCIPLRNIIMTNWNTREGTSPSKNSSNTSKFRRKIIFRAKGFIPIAQLALIFLNFLLNLIGLKIKIRNMEVRNSKKGNMNNLVKQNRMKTFGGVKKYKGK